MSLIGLTESVRGDPRRFEVWLQGRAEVHTFQAATTDIKGKWVAEIKKVLMNQLEELKDEKIKQYGNANHRWVNFDVQMKQKFNFPWNYSGLWSSQTQFPMTFLWQPRLSPELRASITAQKRNPSRRAVTLASVRRPPNMTTRRPMPGAPTTQTAKTNIRFSRRTLCRWVRFKIE